MRIDDHRLEYRRQVGESTNFARADNDLVLEVKADQIVGLLRRYLGDPAVLAVLDIGCGIGLMDGLVAGRIGRLHAIDLGREAVSQAATANGSVRYAVGDGLALPFATGTFDAAFAVCVLHHVPPADWSTFFAEATRVVRPGGLLLAFEHNPWNPATRLVVNRCAFDADATLLSHRTMRRLSRSAGLSAVEERFILYFPWRGGLLRQLERPLGALPFGGQYYAALRKAPAPGG